MCSTEDLQEKTRRIEILVTRNTESKFRHAKLSVEKGFDSKNNSCHAKHTTEKRYFVTRSNVQKLIKIYFSKCVWFRDTDSTLKN
jgi:hypothetical protein